MTDNQKKGFILTITGPSGSGKSTMERRLESQGYARVISTTTREPRPGEVNGVNYHFISRDEFEVLDKMGMLAEAVEFNGNRYGIQSSHLEDTMSQGKPVVIVVEPEGLKQITKAAEDNDWELFRVFVTGPTYWLADRIMQREMGEGGNVKAAAQRVQNLVKNEIRWQFEVEYDYLAIEFGADTEKSMIDHFVSAWRNWAKVSQHILTN